jgi:hypothetical protein
MKSLPPFMREFCLRMVTKQIEDRERNNIVRKDLMQYLIQLRNNSDNKVDVDEWKINASGENFRPEINKFNPRKSFRKKR